LREVHHLRPDDAQRAGTLGPLLHLGAGRQDAVVDRGHHTQRSLRGEITRECHSPLVGGPHHRDAGKDRLEHETVRLLAVFALERHLAARKGVKGSDLHVGRMLAVAW
jgi:hypothetical protein